VSENSIEASREKVKQLMERPLGELRLCAIVIDGTAFKDRQMIVALGIGCARRKTVLGLREGRDGKHGGGERAARRIDGARRELLRAVHWRLAILCRRNYNVIMKTELVQIGNSRGVRIPKAFLEQARLRDKIDMEVRGSQLIIVAANHPRAGWDKAFAAMAARGEGRLVDEAAPTKWDETEWEW